MKEEHSCYGHCIFLTSHTQTCTYGTILQQIKDFPRYKHSGIIVWLLSDQYFYISSQLKNKNSHQQQHQTVCLKILMLLNLKKKILNKKMFFKEITNFVWREENWQTAGKAPPPTTDKPRPIQSLPSDPIKSHVLIQTPPWAQSRPPQTPELTAAEG